MINSHHWIYFPSKNLESWKKDTWIFLTGSCLSRPTTWTASSSFLHLICNSTNCTMKKNKNKSSSLYVNINWKLHPLATPTWPMCQFQKLTSIWNLGISKILCTFPSNRLNPIPSHLSNDWDQNLRYCLRLSLVN